MSIESQGTGRPVGHADAQVDAPVYAPAEPARDVPVDLVDDVDDLAGSELPEPPQTGDEAVDRAVAEVARAVIRPLEDQVAVIDAAHRTLQDRLADVEG